MTSFFRRATSKIVQNRYFQTFRTAQLEAAEGRNKGCKETNLDCALLGALPLATALYFGGKTAKHAKKIHLSNNEIRFVTVASSVLGTIPGGILWASWCHPIGFASLVAGSTVVFLIPYIV